MSVPCSLFSDISPTIHWLRIYFILVHVYNAQVVIPVLGVQLFTVHYGYLSAPHTTWILGQLNSIRIFQIMLIKSGGTTKFIQWALRNKCAQNGHFNIVMHSDAWHSTMLACAMRTHACIWFFSIPDDIWVFKYAVNWIIGQHIYSS